MAKEETEECQFCRMYFPLSLLMKGEETWDDGYGTFEMTVPMCRDCTSSTVPWLEDDQVSDNFTDVISNIEAGKKNG
tara:strand:+ start:312 stop:542 length:231 start_codon:yes stop_codon:yes gene_type:complete